MKRTCQYFLFLGGTIFVLFFMISCHAGNKKENRKEVTTSYLKFKPGKVYDTVPCRKHPHESYALVLPSNYDASKQYPVVFFFDAQARGQLPVRRYKSLADSFGFILVASNQSKNGLTAQERNRIIYHFMEDVEKRFPLNPQRIYTGGFSGGARIAAGIGISNLGIAGTIGCAAGFPQIKQIKNRQLAYVGIVGNTDFNFLEMQQLSRELDNAHWNHCLLLFNGHHQWPPLRTMKKAFYFLQLDAMRHHIIPMDKKTIHILKTYFNKKRKQTQHEKNLLLQWQTDKQAIAFLSGLADISLYQKEAQKLLKDPRLQSQQKLQAKLTEEELKRRKLLGEALQTQTYGWWKNRLENMADEKASAKTTAKRQMVQRLYNYLSLLSYLYADASLKNHRTEAARKYLMIYRFVDPGNPEVYFLEAELFVMTGQSKAKILAALQKAADDGFYDVKRLDTNTLFTSLRNDNRYKKIEQQVKSNPMKEM